MKPYLQKLLELFKGEKKLLNLTVAAGILGMLLIGVSEWIPERQPEQATESTVSALSAEEYASELETRLETLIQQMEGAGNVRVMVTMAESSRTVYATDTETDGNGSTRSEHLLLADGSSPPALVETTQLPQVQGVAVLCEGGDNTAVQARITEMVDVLTGAGASHISVERLTLQQ